jgi:hypothetical protein
MSISEEEAQGSQAQETQETQSTQSSKSNSQNKSQFFKTMPRGFSLKKKVKLTVELHKNDYFIGVPIHEIDEGVSRHITPIKTVTNQYSLICKDAICKNTKLAWLYDKQSEPFCSEFVSELNKNLMNLARLTT